MNNIRDINMYNEIMKALKGSLKTGYYYRRLNKDEGIRTKDDIIYYIYKNEYWKWSFVDFIAGEIMAVRRDRESLFLQRKKNSEYRDLTGAVYMNELGKKDYHYKETGAYIRFLTHIEKVGKAIEDSEWEDKSWECPHYTDHLDRIYLNLVKDLDDTDKEIKEVIKEEKEPIRNTDSNRVYLVLGSILGGLLVVLGVLIGKI